MPAGRPPEYKIEYCEKVDEYIAQCKDEEFDWTRTDGAQSTSYEHRIKVNLPTLEGFSIFLGVSRRVLFDWRDKYPEFLHSLEKINVEQQKRLLDKGLSGDYNPTIAKLVLSANHGMREKSDVTTDGEKMPTPIYGGKSVQGHDSNEEDIQSQEED